MALITASSIHRFLSAASEFLFPHIQAVSGAFMDSQHNGNTPLQTSTSNLNAILPKPAEKEEEDETIWLWVAVIATVGNIVVVAVVCACAF
ncbi:hypothetical protein DPX16_8481 [Anabarilius grahami]|uniref:Uncharacterized protein n=1 Tax=Anabarilius grahami TaxID=495550 RepID=A0A3N0Z4N5_ANAGA|nr:hypothetical protein DPX16_8481 [Anabarilius grahami]